jgi:hypothetical protein
MRFAENSKRSSLKTKRNIYKKGIEKIKTLYSGVVLQRKPRLIFQRKEISLTEKVFKPDEEIKERGREREGEKKVC